MMLILLYWNSMRYSKSMDKKLFWHLSNHIFCSQQKPEVKVRVPDLYKDVTDFVTDDDYAQKIW